MSERLYIGIDLGTYQSTIASSSGTIHTVETVVGRPKDPWPETCSSATSCLALKR